MREEESPALKIVAPFDAHTPTNNVLTDNVQEDDVVEFCQG
jgi:hypothetical protein